MKFYPLVYTRRAELDRQSIYTWIQQNSSSDIANQFVSALLGECQSLSLAPSRGTQRKYGHKIVRSIGYSGRVTIVFQVEAEAVRILRLLYRGRNIDTTSLN